MSAVDAVSASRYLSFEGANAGQQTAIRVTFSDLPPPHDILNGTSMWVGQPEETSEHGGSIEPTSWFSNFYASTLQCYPYYTDWNAMGTVYVYHEGIVPKGLYELQAVSQECSTGYESSYSTPLQLSTERWCDVSGPFDSESGSWTAPDGQVSFPFDILAILDKFVSRPIAPEKVRADLDPATPNRIIDALDLARALDAFRGFPYPYDPDPDPCP